MTAKDHGAGEAVPDGAGDARPGAPTRAGIPTLVIGGLALARLRAQWAMAIALVVGLAAAAAIFSSVNLVGSATSELGYQQMLSTLGTRRMVLIGVRDVLSLDDYHQFSKASREAVRARMGSSLRPGALYVSSESLIPQTLNGKRATGSITDALAMAAYEDLERHVEVVAGTLPVAAGTGGDWPVSVLEAVANRFGLHLGDRYCVGDVHGEAWCTRIAAIWKPRTGGDEYWGSDRLPTALILARPEDYFTLKATEPNLRTFAFAAFSPLLSAFRESQALNTLDDLQHLRGVYSVASERGSLDTGLDAAIGAFLERSQAAQFPLRLVSTQLLLLAVFYLVFVGGQTLDQQRHEFGVWRSRGWPRRRVWLVLMLEFAVLALVALPAGLIGATAISGLVVALAYRGTANLMAWRVSAEAVGSAVVAVGVGLAVLGLLAVGASRAAPLEDRRQASRPTLRPWWQWRNLDLGFVLLSIPLLAQARFLGNIGLRNQQVASADPLRQPAVQADPLSLALPGIAAALLALALLRLLPFAASITTLGGRRLAPMLSRWQLTRRPLQHSRLALLLILTAALGVLSSVYYTTEKQNVADRAAYQVGADRRAYFDGPMPDLDAAARSLKGVSMQTYSYRNFGTPGILARGGMEVLAVDPESFARTAWTRPGLTGQPLPDLLSAIAASDHSGVRLPGQTHAVAMWVYSAGLGGRLDVVLRDSDGRHAQCQMGTLDYKSWRQLETPVCFSGTPRHPLTILEFRVHALPAGTAAPGAPPFAPFGTLAFSQLTSRDSATGTPQVIEPFGAGSALTWWWTADRTGLKEGDLVPSDRVSRGAQPTADFKVDLSQGGFATVRPPPPSAPLGALASAGTLRRLGVAKNQPFQLTIGAAHVQLQVVAQIPHFPTLYPERNNFLVLPEDGLLAQVGFQGEPQAWPNELWADIAATRDGQDHRAWGREARAREVWDRRAIESANARDPLRLGLLANLEIGFAAALSLAVVAFAVHFLLATRGRLGEYAILDANGLAPWVIQRSLNIEQWTILLFSLVCGTAVGVLLSWVILPALALGTGLPGTVPETAVTVSPLLTGGALSAVCLLAGGAGQMATRVARQFRLMDELRFLG